MIGVVGAGAFGTALAVALARDGREVRLWARDGDHVDAMIRNRSNHARLPRVAFPQTVSIHAEMADLAAADAVLLALPMQALAGFLSAQAAALNGLPLVACCKGLDLGSLKGAVALIEAACPASPAAVLTGPSFAADLGKGLPTALTLACASDHGAALQALLSTPALRLYRSTDVTGAEIGGALKNVMAIAAGVVIGAMLGESARAALMTRGYAEMLRLALALGAQAETLAGLSGFGDLVLTCTSLQSRNLRYGIALGSGEGFDPKQTVEGVATARAAVRLAGEVGVEMPVARMVAALIDKKIGLDQAIAELMSRPLKQE